MNIVIISALGNEAARKCINSLYATTPENRFDLFVVRERGFREQALNQALKIVGKEKDVLFVGDDIQFTPGWFADLMTHYEEADILGLSMLYPDTTKIQDRGYDLVDLDGQIILEPHDRGKTMESAAPFNWRACDALCGCFMLVKSGVFKLVPEFREEGRNRFGEFLFAHEARRKGARVAVLEHYLYHHGHSTKSHADKSMSSDSYGIERPVWEKIVRDYVSEHDVRIHRRRVLDSSLSNRLKDLRFQRILFYGVGTVTEFILKNVQLDSRHFAFCSGLPEEAGVDYQNRKIQFIDDVQLSDYDWIVITPLYIGEKIFSEKIKPRLSENSRAVVSVMEIEQSESEVLYKFRDIR